MLFLHVFVFARVCVCVLNVNESRLFLLSGNFSFDLYLVRSQDNSKWLSNSERWP